jgi:hypothetical protein
VAGMTLFWPPYAPRHLCSPARGRPSTRSRRTPPNAARSVAPHRPLLELRLPHDAPRQQQPMPRGLSTSRAASRAPRPSPPGAGQPVTLVLTPTVFFFGELLPKDVFRRRPRRFFALLPGHRPGAAPLPAGRVAPAAALGVLEHLLGVRARDLERAWAQRAGDPARGARAGAAPRAQRLALNVFGTGRTFGRVLVPWGRSRRWTPTRTPTPSAARWGESSFLAPAVVGTSGARRARLRTSSTSSRGPCRPAAAPPEDRPASCPCPPT